LETAALPIGATGLQSSFALLRFAMHGVMAAPPAKFLGLETFRILLLVFRHRVVSFFAVVTLQGNDVAHIKTLALTQ
jgi:hypothetical protein